MQGNLKIDTILRLGKRYRVGSLNIDGVIHRHAVEVGYRKGEFNASKHAIEDWASELMDHG